MEQNRVVRSSIPIQSGRRLNREKSLCSPLPSPPPPSAISIRHEWYSPAVDADLLLHSFNQKWMNRPSFSVYRVEKIDFGVCKWAARHRESHSSCEAVTGRLNPPLDLSTSALTKKMAADGSENKKFLGNLWVVPALLWRWRFLHLDETFFELSWHVPAETSTHSQIVANWNRSNEIKPSIRENSFLFFQWFFNESQPEMITYNWDSFVWNVWRKKPRLVISRRRRMHHGQVTC